MIGIGRLLSSGSPSGSGYQRGYDLPLRCCHGITRATGRDAYRAGGQSRPSLFHISIVDKHIRYSSISHGYRQDIITKTSLMISIASYAFNPMKLSLIGIKDHPTNASHASLWANFPAYLPPVSEQSESGWGFWSIKTLLKEWALRAGGCHPVPEWHGYPGSIAVPPLAED